MHMIHPIHMVAALRTSFCWMNERKNEKRRITNDTKRSGLQVDVLKIIRNKNTCKIENKIILCILIYNFCLLLYGIMTASPIKICGGLLPLKENYSHFIQFVPKCSNPKQRSWNERDTHNQIIKLSPIVVKHVSVPLYSRTTHILFFCQQIYLILLHYKRKSQ